MWYTEMYTMVELPYNYGIVWKTYDRLVRKTRVNVFRL